MKQRTALLLFFSVILFFNQSALGQGAWRWGKTALGLAESRQVATDRAGNVYCGGSNYSLSPSTFDTIVVPYAGPANEAVWVKYSANGNALWAGAAAYGNSYLYDIATDSTGNLIVFGYFSGDSVRIGHFTLMNSFAGTGNQYFLAKMDPLGNVLWALNDGEPFPSALSDPMTADIQRTGGVATDDTGNIYITSTFKAATMTIGTYTLSNYDPTGTTSDVFLAKYSPAGVLRWAKDPAGGPGNDYVFGMTATGTGTVAICGGTRSPMINFSFGGTFVNPSAMDIYMLTYNGGGGGSGAIGQGGSDAYGVGIALDNHNDVYLMGNFTGETVSIFGAPMTRSVSTTVPAPATFLIKYHFIVGVVWATSLVGEGYSLAYSPCTDGIWVSGQGDTTGVTGTDPVFLAGFNNAGTLTNYTALTAGGDDEDKIACDYTGNVYLCADFATSLTVGPSMLTGTTMPPEHFYVAKYGPTPDTVFASHDTTVCGVSSITLTAPAGYSYYYWSDTQATQSIAVSTTGTYVAYGLSCGDSIVADSFHVVLLPDTTYTSQDTFVCYSSTPLPVTLSATGSRPYLWYSGDTTATKTVSGSGSYWVMYKNVCSTVFDTIVVSEYQPGPIIGADSICIYWSPQTFSDSTAGGVWSSSSSIAVIGSATGIARGIAAGTFTVTYTLPGGCYATKTVIVMSRPCEGFVPLVNAINEFRLYPDPAHTQLTIQATNPVISEVVVTNLLGQIDRDVHIGQSDRVQIDIADLPPGMYLVRINSSEVRKFVKE